MSYIQKEFPSFNILPSSLLHTGLASNRRMKVDETFEMFINGCLGPEHDQELTSLYSREELLDLFYFYSKPRMTFSDTKNGLYPNNSYDANLFEYTKTFTSLKSSLKETQIISWPFNKPEEIVIMNGVFNGIPHPGWIEAFLIIKNRFPDKKLVVGLATNLEIEDAKTQLPEGNIKWRASLLANTDLIDNIFTTDDRIFDIGSERKYLNKTNWDNGSVSKEERYYHMWWSRICGTAFGQYPAVIVVNGKEEFARKSTFLDPKRTDVFDLSEQSRLFSEFHSSNVKRQGGYSSEYINESWNKLRREYFTAKQ